jgi:uncharacterized Zn finger protein (UPF0148 family)
MGYYTKSGKVCKSCHSYKELPDFYKNKARKDGKTIHCKICISRKNKESYERNKKSRLEKAQIYRDRNSGRIKDYLKGYQKNNLHKYAAHNSLRNKRMVEATPHWLTDVQKKEMENVYKKAKELTEETGVRYEVDHIVPVRSDLVCGLHVPWNLQVIPKGDNISKSNRHWPDMW